MSPSIWTRCAGRSRAVRLECRAWRVVEGQHLLSTRHLVDSAAEHDLLERLLDDTKPPVPRGPEFAGLHYLLFTPAAFAGKSPLRPAQNWQCTVTAQEDVEYRRHGVGAVERVDFPRATFLVDGKLPHPAV